MRLKIVNVRRLMLMIGYIDIDRFGRKHGYITVAHCRRNFVVNNIMRWRGVHCWKIVAVHGMNGVRVIVVAPPLYLVFRDRRGIM